MDPVLLQVANAAWERERRKEWVKQKRKWKQKRKRKRKRKQTEWRNNPRKKARCSRCGLQGHRSDSPECSGQTKSQLRQAAAAANAAAANAAAENKRMRLFIMYFLDKYCPPDSSPPGSPD